MSGLGVWQVTTLPLKVPGKKKITAGPLSFPGTKKVTAGPFNFPGTIRVTAGPSYWPCEMAEVNADLMRDLLSKLTTARVEYGGVSLH
jgi:hypothetical protein